MKTQLLVITALTFSLAASARGAVMIALGDGQPDPAGVRFFDQSGAPVSPLYQTSPVLDVAAGPTGNLWVLAGGDATERNSDGATFVTFGATGYSCVDVSSSGIIALGDSQPDPAGLRFFNSSGAAISPLFQTAPVNDLAFGPTGNAFVLAGGNVMEMTTAGSIVNSFGASGYSTIDVSSSGVIVLGDSTPDPSGVRFFNQTGSALTPLIQTAAVSDLAFAPSGNAFIVANGNVIEMNTSGTTLNTFGATGYSSIAVIPEPLSSLACLGLVGALPRRRRAGRII